MKPGCTGARGTRPAIGSQLLREKNINDRQRHAPKTPNESSGKSGGCSELTKGPAALPVVRAHLEVRAMSWEGKDTGGLLMGSCEAEGSFLVPLGKRCSSEKGKDVPCKDGRRTLRQRRAAKQGGLRATGVSDTEAPNSTEVLVQSSAPPTTEPLLPWGFHPGTGSGSSEGEVVG